MKGYVLEMYRLYDGANDVLVVPVYQRNYDWSTKECGRLFDDLEEMLRTGRKKHFFGAVVGKAEGSWKWVVIDGQQRLTTVSLLMLALVHAIRDGEIEVADPALGKRITRSYLTLDDGTGDVKFKLKPVKGDAQAYELLYGPEDRFRERSTVTANYRYLRKRLRETELTGDQVWTAIEGLEVMQLDLEDEDDPQRIFESINSTGRALKEADKIRNLVLMDLDSRTQERLYDEYWNPMERNVAFRTDWFIRWWLVTRTGKTPNQAAVYEAFRAYVDGSSQPIEEILADLCEYSEICRDIENATTGFPEVDAQLRRFNIIKGDVMLPLLMPVLRDVRAGETTPEDFVAVIRILESYLFRRITCAIAANALNKIFAAAHAELRKLRRNEESYADLLTYILLRRDGGGRFPDDEEFGAAFAERDSYRLRPNYRRYLFDCLENGQSNDCRDIAKSLESGVVTVEHIMPQTLTDAWRQELGSNYEEIHSTWRHRIANLTVTGYNSDFSNRTFQRKRDMPSGFKDSPYRINKYVEEQDHWGLPQLQERSRLLTDNALAYWRMPKTDFTPPQAVLPTEPLGEDRHFTGRSIVAFEFQDTRQTVRNWQEMLVSLLRVLVQEHRPALLDFAERSPMLAVVGDEGDSSPIRLRNAPKVDESLAVASNSSTNDKVHFLRKLFAHLGIDTNELVFTLRPVKAAPAAEEKTGRFDDLTKFIAEFDEAASQEMDFDSTAAIRREFRSTFRPFAREDATGDLKPGKLKDFEDAGAITNATDVQVLAALTLTLRMADDFDEEAFHERILNGTASAWLRRLEELG